MKNPLVSIAMLSYNRLDDLKESVERLSDIIYPNLEFLIVDNGSTDGASNFIKSLDEKYFTKIFLKKNFGIGFGRLTALLESKGDIIISIDDDCYITQNVVDNTIELFETNPNLGAIGYPNVNPDSEISINPSEIDNSLKLTNNYSSCFDGVLALCSSAWRKDALDKINLKEIKIDWIKINHNRKQFSDTFIDKQSKVIKLSAEIESDICYALCAHGYNTVQIPELIAFHKVSPTNRNQDWITREAILRYLRNVINYYPYEYLLTDLFRSIYLCIYQSLLKNRFIYFSTVLSSIFKPSFNIFNKVRLKKNVFNKMRKLTIEPAFSYEDIKKVLF